MDHGKILEMDLIVVLYLIQNKINIILFILFSNFINQKYAQLSTNISDNLAMLLSELTNLNIIYYYIDYS